MSETQGLVHHETAFGLEGDTHLISFQNNKEGQDTYPLVPPLFTGDYVLKSQYHRRIFLFQKVGDFG